VEQRENYLIELLRW